MYLLDNSVLVNANRIDQPEHATVRAWLNDALGSEEKLVVLDQVWLGTLRVLTNSRVYANPTTVKEAIHFLSELTSYPNVIRAAVTVRCIQRVEQWAMALNVKGDHVPDAYLAAAALELDATMVTCDRGFRRYPGLRWMRPGEHTIMVNPLT